MSSWLRKLVIKPAKESEIRRVLRTKIRNLSAQERAASSQVAVQSFLSSGLIPEKNTQSHIALYRSMDDELDLTRLEEALRASPHQIYYPRMEAEEGQMEMVCQDNSIEGSSFWEAHPMFSVQQPGAHFNPVDPEILDVIVVPGLAYCYDPKGRILRLGRGKGYYDRYLSRLGSHTLRVALAYDFQFLPEASFEAQDWDEPIDLLVTDQKVVRS